MKQRWIRSVEAHLRLLRHVGMAVAFLSGSMMATNLTIPLWPAGPPDSGPNSGPEHDTTTPQDHMVAGRRVARITNVSSPTLTIYRPSKPRDTGATVVVFPGGGYRILAMDLEGTEICEWLNSIGITAVLAKYRVPEPEGVPRYERPLQDAQRAVGIVRSHAKEWELDSNRIGVLGFSAGGHLSAVLSDHSIHRTYAPVDDADQVSCRPDFVLLIYPAYLSVGDKGETLAPETQPTSNNPPTFIVQAEDDKPFIDGTLLYYRALKDHHVAAEMHIYSSGGHGYGLRATTDPVTGWPRLAEAWFRHLGLME